MMEEIIVYINNLTYKATIIKRGANHDIQRRGKFTFKGKDSFKMIALKFDEDMPNDFNGTPIIIRHENGEEELIQPQNCSIDKNVVIIIFK